MWKSAYTWFICLFHFFLRLKFYSFVLALWHNAVNCTMVIQLIGLDQDAQTLSARQHLLCHLDESSSCWQLLQLGSLLFGTSAHHSPPLYMAFSPHPILVLLFPWSGKRLHLLTLLILVIPTNLCSIPAFVLLQLLCREESTGPGAVRNRFCLTN